MTCEDKFHYDSSLSAHTVIHALILHFPLTSEKQEMAQSGSYGNPVTNGSRPNISSDFRSW